MDFKKILTQDISENFIKLIGTDWMLINAGTKNKHNCMTASWGGVGFLWRKPVSFIFIRPNRYTFEFTETNEYYSINFFDDSFRDVLNFCGTKSGKNVDKMNINGLTPIFSDNVVYYKEAKLVLICKKVYSDFIQESNFIDQQLVNLYPQKDFHKMYIGEITDALIKI